MVAPKLHLRAVRLRRSDNTFTAFDRRFQKLFTRVFTSLGTKCITDTDQRTICGTTISAKSCTVIKAAAAHSSFTEGLHDGPAEVNQEVSGQTKSSDSTQQRGSNNGGVKNIYPHTHHKEPALTLHLTTAEFTAANVAQTQGFFSLLVNTRIIHVKVK